MHKPVFLSALTLALAVSGTAFGQSPNGAANSPAPVAANPQKEDQHSAALTVEKLTQDLQKAGFSEVKVLQDAFLVQAKTKDGNPILMSVGPNGMRALEFSKASSASQETTGQAPPNNSPTSAPAKAIQH
jgi:hypothetical protein